MGWSEDSLHRWLAGLARRRPLRRAASAQGHDAIVLRALRGRATVCTDQTVEGVHFEAGERPSAVGRKAASRVLSDLAAAAAEPRVLLLALAAPAERDERWLRAAIEAVARRAEEFGAELVAGDLSVVGGPAVLAVTGVGEHPRTGRPPGRERARPGQRVVLTGPVGGSLLGRHLSFRPRVAEGLWLHARGATAMMDVSDGLALDLWRLARASGVRIDLEEVPVHRDARRMARRSGREPLWHALHDGEDHELVATLAPRALERVLAEAPRRAPDLVAIGRVRRGRGLYVRRGEELAAFEPRADEPGGWLHGG